MLCILIAKQILVNLTSLTCARHWGCWSARSCEGQRAAVDETPVGLSAISSPSRARVPLAPLIRKENLHVHSFIIYIPYARSLQPDYRLRSPTKDYNNINIPL